MKRLSHWLLATSLTLGACGQNASPETEATTAPESPNEPPTLPAPAEPAPQQTAQATPPATPPAEPDLVDERDKVQEILNKVRMGLELAQALKTAVETTVERTGEIPEDVNTRAVLPASPDVRSVNLSDGGLIIVDYRDEEGFPGGTIELRPEVEDGRVTWDCSGGTLPSEFRPDDCG